MNSKFADLLIQAINSSESPKMALDGAKHFLGESGYYSIVFRACFEKAWSDAEKRNKAIEKSRGKSNWPQRKNVNAQEQEEAIDSLKKSEDFQKNLGSILCEWDEASIRRVLGEVITNL